MLVLVILIFFALSPGGRSPLITVFDLESVAVVVIGMIAIVIAAIGAFLSGAADTKLVAAGLIFMMIYTFYIWRMLKSGLKVRLEIEEIKKKYGELVELEREKSDFITVTSHQLRTSLSGIKWSLESIVKDPELSKDITSALQSILTNVNRIVRIVNDMIKTQTFEQEKVPVLQRKEFDLSSLVSEIVEELDAFAREKNVTVNFASPDKTVRASADRDLLRLAIKHVVDNAIRYSPGGSVDITLSEEGKSATLRITDTGIGIPPEDFSRVFKKFYRGKNAFLVSPDGSGVGLHTAKGIIEAHGGTINFFSKLKKGSTFIITLPL